MIIDIAGKKITVDPSNWNVTLESAKLAVDSDLADRIHLGQIEGVYPMAIEPDMAQRIYPELSSLNKSILWNKVQAVAVGYPVASIDEAIDIILNLCLPVAKEAYTQQLGSLTENPKVKCSWPPSVFAAHWVAWCETNTNALSKVKGSQYESSLLQKAKAWEIGETATGWIENRVPVKEGYNTEKAQYERIWFDGKISVGVDSVHGQAEE